MKKPVLGMAAVALAVSLAVAASAQQSSQVTPDMIQTGSDIPKDWQQPEDNFDYVKKEVMIPMRDGVKLHTVIIIPKNAHDAPMLLERTPYNALSTNSTNSPHMREAVWGAQREWVDDGYIIVNQDIRGKY